MSRFKGKLVEMIKNANSRFDDHSISAKTRQNLLHWEYELTESDLFLLKSQYFFVNIKISHYWFNKKGLLQKAKENYDNGGKEETAEYYQSNKDVIK